MGSQESDTAEKLSAHMHSGEKTPEQDGQGLEL